MNAFISSQQSLSKLSAIFSHLSTEVGDKMYKELAMSEHAQPQWRVSEEANAAATSGVILADVAAVSGASTRRHRERTRTSHLYNNGLCETWGISGGVCAWRVLGCQCHWWRMGRMLLHQIELFRNDGFEGFGVWFCSCWRMNFEWWGWVECLNMIATNLNLKSAIDY